MKPVVYTSPFVPAEWIAAHGLVPSRRVPLRPAADAPEGACPFATAFVRDCAAAEGPAIVATTCDQLRRGAETIQGRIAGGPDRGLFLLHVPSAAGSPSAAAFYRAELERLGRFLIRNGGIAPDPTRVLEEMRRWGAVRRRLRAWRGRLDAVELARRIARFHRDGHPGCEPPAMAPRPGPAVMVLGGPLTDNDLGILAGIEQAGAHVEADGSETGERCWPREYDEARADADPLDELAAAHFDAIPDVFRRPDDLLHRWVREIVASRRIRGIVVVVHVWCDLWRAAAERMRETAGVPLLILDLRGSDGGGGAGATRIQAFVESIR